MRTKILFNYNGVVKVGHVASKYTMVRQEVRLGVTALGCTPHARWYHMV
jgi:hypothetical protein